MPSKNNLSAIKAQNKNTLQKIDKLVPKVGGPKVGRKPKPIANKESEAVVLKITPEEMECLKKKAGLVPLGTFVKHLLRNKTDLFG